MKLPGIVAYLDYIQSNAPAEQSFQQGLVEMLQQLMDRLKLDFRVVSAYLVQPHQGGSLIELATLPKLKIAKKVTYAYLHVSMISISGGASVPYQLCTIDKADGVLGDQPGAIDEAVTSYLKSKLRQHKLRNL